MIDLQTLALGEPLQFPYNTRIERDTISYYDLSRHVTDVIENRLRQRPDYFERRKLIAVISGFPAATNLMDRAEDLLFGSFMYQWHLRRELQEDISCMVRANKYGRESDIEIQYVRVDKAGRKTLQILKQAANPRFCLIITKKYETKKYVAVVDGETKLRRKKIEIHFKTNQSKK